MMPDKASLYLSAIEDQEYREEKIGFWDDVYGFDYSCIKELRCASLLWTQSN